MQLLPQFAFGESFVAVPYHIMFGQVNQVAAFVFTEWHFGMGKFDEEFLLVVHIKERRKTALLKDRCAESAD